jgi:hypothetical protein
MLHTARVWQLGAGPQQSALFTGRASAAQAYRMACDRRDAIVHHRDDTLNAEALQHTGAVLVRGHDLLTEPGVPDVDGRRLHYQDLVINTDLSASVGRSWNSSPRRRHTLLRNRRATSEVLHLL